MKNINFIRAAALVLIGSPLVFAQPNPPAPKPNGAETVARSIEQIINQPPVSRERRGQAYAKLLEGQRYIWTLTNRSRGRSQAAVAADIRLALQSLRQAVELDPRLAEGYTALAELITLASPKDLEEALALAAVAVKIDPNNFGGRRILARLYTVKSGLGEAKLDANHAQRAIAEWREIARLDPRNAEAQAFLSEFYRRAGKNAERLAALRKWIAAAAPLAPEARFYQTLFRGESDLSTDSATLKLAQALLETGATREAIEILSRAVADDPENAAAIELLRQAVESPNAGDAAAIAVQSLQQAVYANPENTILIEMLARVQLRAGKPGEAAKVLNDAATKLAGKNKNAAADLQIALGELYEQNNQPTEAVAAYQNALTARGIGADEAATDDERDFAIRAFGKIIDAHQKANRLSDAKAVIERARAVLGKADTFADRRLVGFYLGTGRKAEALQAVRDLRRKTPADGELVRLEARLLTENGRVEEAVALVKSAPAANVGADDERSFTVNRISPAVADQLFVSELYTLAKRPKEAVQAVSQALPLAKSEQEKEIVRLTLATMQQTNGETAAAETTLREILKESPRNSIALNNLGYFLAERGEKLDEALRLIEQALAIEPNNSSYLDSLGWTYFKLGKLAEAEKNLKAAIAIDDTSATVQEHLGDVYQKQGKTDLANAAWQKALTLTAEPDETNRLKTKLKIK